MKPSAPFLLQRGLFAALPALFVLALAPVHAQEAPAEESASPASTEEAAADADPLSPRAALDDYLTLCRQSRFEEAAAYLPAVPVKEEAAEAARRLKIVLDRYIWFDMSQVSGARGGDTDDDLPEGRERLGVFESAGGTAVVEMVQTTGDDPPGWVFAAETIRRIDPWYAELDRSWIQDRLPAWLLRSGPLELQWWQWVALPIALLLAWLIARLAVSILRPLLLTWTRRSVTEIDDLLVDRLAAPATLFLLLLVFRSIIAQIDLVIPAHEFIAGVVRGAFLAGVFWTLMRLVDVALALVQRSAWLAQRRGLAVMTPFLGRLIRTVVLALGAITILQEFGFQVTGLLAGMGLAGMAVALAGQKTVENLIGSGTLLADQPFRPGDFVRIGDLIGTVEVVGLRSTRIRTLDRTLVTLPNGSLSEMRLETFAARDRCRLLCTIGLTYGTRVEQMRKIMSDLEEVLRTHPRVGDDPLRVRFVEFGASSLNIEILAYVLTTDWAEFVELRQELYLRFMEVVEANGGSFAFPTQTIHVESLPRATASGLDGRAS